MEPTQPRIQWVPSAVSLRIERSGREANWCPREQCVKFVGTPHCILQNYSTYLLTYVLTCLLTCLLSYLLT